LAFALNKQGSVTERGLRRMRMLANANMADQWVGHLLDTIDERDAEISRLRSENRRLREAVDGWVREQEDILYLRGGREAEWTIHLIRSLLQKIERGGLGQ